ncbi:DUF429 domain-containing protein [Rubellimicrobium aerolatum]|uniref:DUF429 domain-containing protein n=1 Tax=Rubellimicrobium aerolatum TaxID=490979 RepID=A0ABW0S9I1_9RHOB|nr:hypothetical protein [Rubellimicrobium aerolatum]
MRIYGIDFTSAPSRRKPICVAVCRLDGDRLIFERMGRLASLDAFEAALQEPGPWVAGFDFPFTQSRTFLRNMNWPEDWLAYADFLIGMDGGKAQFRAALEDYKARREKGQKEHFRSFEAGIGAASPQKLDYVPVALMQFAGVPRLKRAGVHLPGLCDGDPSRVAVEAYPGVAARGLIGKRPYKNDAKTKQTLALAEARKDLLGALTGDEGRTYFDLTVQAPARLAEDPTGDAVDALLCAVQAAWAARLMRDAPERLDALDLSEGWIADPEVLKRLPRRGAYSAASIR